MRKLLVQMWSKSVDDNGLNRFQRLKSLLRPRFVFIGVLLLLALAGSGLTTPGQAQTEPTLTLTSTPTLSPPPPPPPPAPDVSGTWHVTRSWFRRCPGCSEPVIRSTTWTITQQGDQLRVDKGPRGTIEGSYIHLEGLESNGFERFDFIYGALHLSPDGLTISGTFVGSETLQNPCDLTPPLVTCFVNVGDFYAVRRSPAPPPPVPPPPSPTRTGTPTLTATATQPATPSPTPSVTPTPTATAPPAGPAAVAERYLPIIIRLASPTPVE